MFDPVILIVDDEESLRLTFEMFLRREGYEQVKVASTLAQAKELLNTYAFDLIISDIVLEGDKGTDLLRHIRETGINCPVVMITGFPNLDSASEAVRYGAFDYLPKPVNKEKLLKTVAQALKYRELEREKQELIRKMNAINIIWRRFSARSGMRSLPLTMTSISSSLTTRPNNGWKRSTWTLPIGSIRYLVKWEPLALKTPGG